MTNTLTELPKHWDDEIENAFIGFETKPMQLRVLKSLNSLLASGKARIVDTAEWSGGIKFIERRLIIDPGDTE